MINDIYIINKSKLVKILILIHQIFELKVKYLNLLKNNFKNNT